MRKLTVCEKLFIQKYKLIAMNFGIWTEKNLVCKYIKPTTMKFYQRSPEDTKNQLMLLKSSPNIKKTKEREIDWKVCNIISINESRFHCDFCNWRNIYTINRKRKGKLLLKNQEISEWKTHKHMETWYILAITDAFLDQKTVNVHIKYLK